MPARPGRSPGRTCASGGPLLAAVLMLSGCASTGAHLNEGHRIHTGADVDRVWAELDATYRELGLPVAEPPFGKPVISSGDLVLNEGRLPRISGRRLVNCPVGGDSAGSRRVDRALLRVRTWVEDEGPTVDLISRVEAWRITDGDGVRPCRSTGVLERLIADRIRTRI